MKLYYTILCEVDRGSEKARISNEVQAYILKTKKIGLGIKIKFFKVKYKAIIAIPLPETTQHDDKRIYIKIK